jgi:drug/metabolite transporter (DMT)-like permease
MGGRNPISLCNILFVGNLCALLLLVMIHWRQLNQTTLRRLSRQEWVGLVMVALLSGALAPGLIFQALSETAVNNVVLAGRLELALSVWILRERVNGWEVGAIAALFGVTLTIILQPPRVAMIPVETFSISAGELLAVAGAVALATSAIISKNRLARLPLGLFSTVRTALGTIIFFCLALLLYSAVIVVVGQSFWLAGLRSSSLSMASSIASFAPIAGILAAYFILGEAPT